MALLIIHCEFPVSLARPYPNHSSGERNAVLKHKVVAINFDYIHCLVSLFSPHFFCVEIVEQKENLNEQNSGKYCSISSTNVN